MRLMFQRRDNAYVGVEIISVDKCDFFWRYIGESTFHKLDCEII